MNRIATFVKGIGKLCGAYLSFNFLNAKMKKWRRGSCLPWMYNLYICGILGVILVLSLLFLSSSRNKRKEST